MPDPQVSNQRPPLPPRAAPPVVARPRYAELHCKTNFSFLEGASHADELVTTAAELGYAALAVTDRNSLAGVVRAHLAAKEVGLKLLVGAELTLADARHVVLWATDRAAYGRLSQLITRGRRRAPKGQFQLAFADLAEHAQGLLAGVLLRDRDFALPLPPGEGRGEGSGIENYQTTIGNCKLRAEEIDPGEQVETLAAELARFREVFGDRTHALAELLHGPHDERDLDAWTRAARSARVPLVAAGDVHYHARARLPLADVLTAVRWGTTVAASGERLFPNAERYLKSPAEMAARFARLPAAIARTAEIADRCTFSLAELRYEYPEELSPPGETPLAYLTRLAWAGAAKRYPSGVPEKVRQLIVHELELIAALRYEAYFLTVFDLVRFARRRGILCQGRGSAANSAVCYCLGITAVDPERMDLLFERFVSRERQEAPDIDVDFEHERREEVLQYVYEKYGRDRAGMTAEVITYRPRSAVRDVGQALAIDERQIDALAKSMEGYHHEPQLAERIRGVGLDPQSAIGRRLLHLVQELTGFPRHLGQHVGGMVITQGPLAELVPIENAAMDGRTVIQWDKNDLDELGILKVDCLSLGMLTAIRKCLTMLRDQGVPRFAQVGRGSRPILAWVPAEDPRVYDMICRADTLGVFQIESRAQMSMLPRLKPRMFYDLVIEVAIVRPGPIQGDMVHPYLRRRAGEEAVTFPNQAIRGVLEKTLGVPLFQEQAMRLAVVAAGFTPGQADQLRRAMGAWRRPGAIEQFRQQLIDGMRANGLAEEFAARVFEQIRGFGEYGFPESHAASFALLVYVSAWLKCYYPAAFAAALVNSQPMGFYAPAQLVRDARQHGVDVRPIDVNASEWDCVLEGVGARGQGPGIGDQGPGARDQEEEEEEEEEEDKQTWRQGDTETGCDPAVRGWAVQTSDSSLPWSLAPGPWPPTPHSPAPNSLRLGFRLASGFSQRHAERIVAARAAGPFRSLEDFVRRTKLSRAVLVRLAEVDAFASLGLGRRGALWQSLAQDHEPEKLPLLADLADDEPPPIALPALSQEEEVLADYHTVGLSLKNHPLAFVRARLDELGVVPAAKLSRIPDGRFVRTAGLVLVRQRPGTAKGITFVTLEDETGTSNLIIRQDVWQRFRPAARTAVALLAAGRLQKQGQVIHVLVGRLEDLTKQLSGMASRSRDFQ